MLWFRLAFVIFMSLSMVIGVGLVWAEMQGGIEGMRQQAIEDDPAKNGTMGHFVFLLLFQFLLLGTGVFGIFVAVKVWQNNFQLDHKIRHLFIVWLACWCCAALGLLGVCIYALVKRKDQKTHMAFLFDVFSRNAQNNLFVASMERYQRNGNCCGIYGPDDWLMVQIRPMPFAGGGGGSFRSMDYGFRQNPSTGKCHLVPPTIPIGCGSKIVEEVNAKLGLFAGLAIFQTLVALTTGVLAWYCFFYWLEKEVIVIPENEVSNLIIIEPESDESVAAALAEGGGSYYQSGSRYLGNSSRPIAVMSMRSSARRSGGYGSSSGGSGGGPGPFQPGIDGAPPQGTSQAQPGVDAAGNQAPPTGNPENQSGPEVVHVPTNGVVTTAMAAAVTTQPISVRTHKYLPSGGVSTAAYPPYMGSGGGSGGGRGQSRYLVPKPYMSRKKAPNPLKRMSKKQVEEEVLKIQEKALGGKVLGEMHIDHKLDPKGASGGDPTPGKAGQKRHATVAIVRQKPKPKDDTKDGHKTKAHGQTGHLAEDIAEMSGRRAGSYIEDVAIPLNNPHVVQLPSSENVHHRPPGIPHGHGMHGSLAGSKAALDLENVLENKVPTIKKASNRYLHPGGGHEPYLGHTGGSSPEPYHHPRGYLGASRGGYLHAEQQHDRYMHTGAGSTPAHHYIPLEHHVNSEERGHGPYHHQHEGYLNEHHHQGGTGHGYLNEHHHQGGYLNEHHHQGYLNEHHPGGGYLHHPPGHEQHHDRYIHEHHEHDRYLEEHHHHPNHHQTHPEHHQDNPHHNRYIHEGGHHEGGHQGQTHSRYIHHEQQQQQQHTNPTIPATPATAPPVTEVLYKNSKPLAED